jgi:peptide deformylase
MIKEILTYPNQILSETAKKVAEINDDIRQKISDMKETLKSLDNAVGLAANQVGILDSIITYYESVDKRAENEDDIKVVINPRVEIVEPDFQISNEGCLCLPNVYIPVRRYRSVRLFGLGENGEQIDETVSDQTANIVQHEVDHVNGLLIIDHLSKLQKQLYKKRLRGVK